MIGKQVFRCDGRGCEKTSAVGEPDAERWVSIKTSVAIQYGSFVKTKAAHACSPACEASILRAWAESMGPDPRTDVERTADRANSRFVALQGHLAKAQADLKEEAAKRVSAEESRAMATESLRIATQTNYLESHALRDRLEAELRKNDELRARLERRARLEAQENK